MKGQEGNDTVKDEARGDADRLFGNAGDGSDVLNCGTGKPGVFARDAGDEVKQDCERPF